MNKKTLRHSIIALTLLNVTLAATSRTLQAQQSYTFLQTGFTQEIFGSAPAFFGGVAFAANGDVWVDECLFNGSPLIRFSLASTIVVNSTTIHPQAVGSPFASNAGCGLTNHPDGTLYSNTNLGVVNVDANTAVQLRPPFGLPGNALGITVDPQTNRLVYVAADCRFTATCTIVSIDPISTASTNFAVLNSSDAQFVDGIAFEATGNFLFLSNRAPLTRLTILNRSGSIVQHVVVTSEPDGIAFHATTPPFIVTNNTDGTITRFDFPLNNFAATPTQSVLASGGGRSDLSQVGPDNCLYGTQDSFTRYNDGTVTSESSLVRICPNFLPPPGVSPVVALSFPLPDLGPYSAKINTVFDHHMTHTYCADGVVRAYTGEKGDRNPSGSFGPFATDCPDGNNILQGFQNETGTAFVINGSYAGGNEPNVLFYDGHPGYDYKTIDQAPVVSQPPTEGRIPVLAAADGTLSWDPTPTDRCPDGGGPFGIMQIESSGKLFSRYLHLDCRSFSTDFFRNIFGIDKDNINPRTVKRGEVIAIAGDTGVSENPHLHFELRENEPTGVPIDPYGWQSTEPDPYTAHSNAPHAWRGFTEWVSPWPVGGAPRGIRVDPEGNVWFDQEADVCAIGRLEPAEEKNTFTFWTVDPNPSCSRGGIDLDLLGGKVRNVWFTYGDGEIRKLSPSTNDMTVWITSGFNPSIAVDRLGNAYFPDRIGNTIGRIVPITNQYTRWAIPTLGSGPISIKVAAGGPFRGKVFFTEGAGKIAKLDPATGTFLEWALPTPGVPFGLFLDENGNAWFTERLGNRIGMLNPLKNELLEFSIPTDSSEPRGITKSPGKILTFVELAGNKLGGIIPIPGKPTGQSISPVPTLVTPTTTILIPSGPFHQSSVTFTVPPSHTTTVPTLTGNNRFLEAKLPNATGGPFAIDVWKPDELNPHPSTLYFTQGANRIGRVTLW